MWYQVKLTLNVEADSRGDVIDAVVREVKVARVQVSVADAAFEIAEMGNADEQHAIEQATGRDQK